MKIKIAGVILRTQTIKICVQKNNSGDLVSRCNTDPLLGRLFQFSNIFFWYLTEEVIYIYGYIHILPLCHESGRSILTLFKTTKKLLHFSPAFRIPYISDIRHNITPIFSYTFSLSSLCNLFSHCVLTKSEIDFIICVSCFIFSNAL